VKKIIWFRIYVHFIVSGLFYSQVSILDIDFDENLDIGWSDNSIFKVESMSNIQDTSFTVYE
jgi:hypothetical protein